MLCSWWSCHFGSNVVLAAAVAFDALSAVAEVDAERTDNTGNHLDLDLLDHVIGIEK
jgi:hypothetical protein